MNYLTTFKVLKFHLIPIRDWNIIDEIDSYSQDESWNFT